MVLRALLSCPSSFSISVAHPIATKTIPPPTCTTGSEIPKKARMYVPVKYEPTSSTKLSNAIRHDNVFRASELYPPVSARKNGLPPMGSTIGKIALRISNRLFAASSMRQALSSSPPLFQVRARQHACVLAGIILANEASQRKRVTRWEEQRKGAIAREIAK